jgi:hypothetical protein
MVVKSGVLQNRRDTCMVGKVDQSCRLDEGAMPGNIADEILQDSQVTKPHRHVHSSLPALQHNRINIKNGDLYSAYPAISGGSRR